jgi:hypothetical protein
MRYANFQAANYYTGSEFLLVVGDVKKVMSEAQSESEKEDFHFF